MQAHFHGTHGRAVVLPCVSISETLKTAPGLGTAGPKPQRLPAAFSSSALGKRALNQCLFAKLVAGKLCAMLAAPTVSGHSSYWFILFLASFTKRDICSTPDPQSFFFFF